MTVLFCRRLRLEIDLNHDQIAEPVLPPSYRWLEWSPELLRRHAEVKFRSFAREIDGQIFPSLSTIDGCLRLMDYITEHPHFVSPATKLLTYENATTGQLIDCGTIQGISSMLDSGAVQNVGIVREHRGLGLGRALVQTSLLGFRASGLTHISLEVTAANEPAVQLYLSLGFRVTKTLYRSVDER